MNPLTSSILHSVFVDNSAKNWVFSPASYLEAMSNLAVCLKGQNLAELISVAPDIGQPQSLGLDTYNCLLYSAEYRLALNEAVLDVLHSRNTELRSFVGEEVVDIVNGLVYEKTRGKISNLISRSDLGEFTKFIILNCVYFKQEWVDKFDEDHYAHREFRGATKTSKVKFLHNQIRSRRYFEGEGYDIVELTYKNTEVCCYLLVPTTKGLFEIFDDLNNYLDNIAKVKSGLDVNLTVPPFKIESEFKGLASWTFAAGVQNAFRWNKEWELVNWKLLKDEAVMKVEKIVQKAYIDFTKDGTEAAAATAIMVGLSGCCFGFTEPPPVKYIKADQPFVFVLARPEEPDKPLFVGVVMPRWA